MKFVRSTVQACPGAFPFFFPFSLSLPPELLDLAPAFVALVQAVANEEQEGVLCGACVERLCVAQGALRLVCVDRAIGSCSGGGR